jgi:zinc/manganese transport system substrate-binding protein
MKTFVLLLALLFETSAQAKLSVVTTTPDLGALVEAVGGEEVKVDVIAKGTQDPHFIEAKPSYMVKVSKADLVLAVGLSLEVGWLPSLITGARNPKVNPGSAGYIEVGPLADPLDVAKGEVSRAGGDVHPDGNPHINLDPVRMGRLANNVAAKLGELDPAHKELYIDRAKKFDSQMNDKTAQWQERIKKTGVKQVITYHNDVLYFLERFGMKAVGFLEPKPGIPPTAQHLMEIMKLIKREKVSLVFIENYFDTKIATRLTADAPETRIKVVGIAVGSKPELKSTSDVIEQLVRAIEEK